MTEAEAREATAYHEAGHAVIGRILGLRCGHVTIVADEDSSGHAIAGTPEETYADWEREGKLRDLNSALVGRILAHMAGAEAEVALLGKCRGGDGDDRREIALMLATVGRSGHERIMREKTAALVRRHRVLIEAVARALLAHETLTSEAISAMVDGDRLALNDRLRRARQADREAMAWQFSD